MLPFKGRGWAGAGDFVNRAVTDVAIPLVLLPASAGGADGSLVEGRASRNGGCYCQRKRSQSYQQHGIHRQHLRESMEASCTVVMGPSSGTLIFLLRLRLCSLILRRSPLLAADSFSLLSALEDWEMAWVKACSGSRSLDVLVWPPLGKSWYFLLSGWNILQANDCFSAEAPGGDITCRHETKRKAISIHAYET